MKEMMSHHRGSMIFTIVTMLLGFGYGMYLFGNIEEIGRYGFYRRSIANNDSGKSVKTTIKQVVKKNNGSIK